MVDRPIDTTILAGFRGIPFYVKTETQDGGRKVVVHDYPGSDKRFVQDLGQSPGGFRIQGYVADFKRGGGAVLKSKQLDRKLTAALNSKDTEGILDLSVFGMFKVKPVSFSKTVSQTDIGVVEYSMTFMRSTSNPSPSFAPSNSLTTATKAADVLSAVQDDVAELLVPPTTATMTKVSTYDGTQTATSIADKIASLGQDIDTVTSHANNVRDNIAALVRDPVTYASAMFNDGLLGAVFDTVETSRDALKALSDLARTGYNLSTDFKSLEEGIVASLDRSFDIPEFANDTHYRITNNNNRLILIKHTRVAVFATYLKMAADSEYATVSDITLTMTDINDIYENTILIEDIRPETAIILDRCRVDALKVLEDKQQTTPKVKSLELHVPTVDIILAYDLYGDTLETVEDLTDRADVLTDLNEILPTRFSGTVEVLK